MTKDEALRIALDMAEWLTDETKPTPTKTFSEIAAAIREVLAQPERPDVQGEPVAYMNPEDLEKMKRFGRGSVAWATPTDFCTQPVYTKPQPAVPERKPLTEEKIQKLLSQHRFAVFALVRAVEAAHGIKENT